MDSNKVFYFIFLSGLLIILSSCATSEPATGSGDLRIQEIRPLEKCSEMLSEPSAIDYPQTIAPDELEGEATVNMTLNRKGMAENIQVEESTDNQLPEIVTNELEQLRFTPTLCGDFPVPVQVTVLFTF